VSKYIALEGGDGAGKSTVATALARRLEEAGKKVISVREPGGTKLGEAIRALLLESARVDDWAEAFLFAAQRAELAREVIAPALEAGVWVISDRSYYSSIAYQGRGRGLGEEEVRAVNELGLGGVVPHHVFALDVDPAVALSRQDGEDRIGTEGVELQAAVRRAYRDLARRDETVTLLPGALSVGEMVDRIAEVVL